MQPGTFDLLILLFIFLGLQAWWIIPIIIKNNKLNKRGNDLREEILSVEGVESVSGVLENKALLRHDEKEVVCFIKGVDNNFAEQERIVNNITDGSFSFKENNLDSRFKIIFDVG